ncbi:hypothetical protein FACS189487_06670 [Campylobacterota bacterium]|nr:hypothetical protein FACS189487_06670 [Campylobacterota bacterium]
MSSCQKHLSRTDAVNLGSFYTNAHLVALADNILSEAVCDLEKYTILDSSCGYGSFLNKSADRVIGADIDSAAIGEAKKLLQGAEFININSLKNVKRDNFKIGENEKLIIVGNPPYNDTTSIIRNSIKNSSIRDEIDADIRTRDTGMSFLLSYNKLQADFVCVLHPLSYLIKKTNFALLNNFAKNYRLIGDLVISSREFVDTSRSMAFPILTALYKRDNCGMDYDFIYNYKFKIKEGGIFSLSSFDTIANYVQKYPNKKYLASDTKPIAKFWTLRDINALKRNRTFIDEDSYNTIYVLTENLPYYCYIDIFKQYADKMPYFLGNCDIIIDHEKFIKIKDCFAYQSVQNNPILRKNINCVEIPNAKQKIDNYFNELLDI